VQRQEEGGGTVVAIAVPLGYSTGSQTRARSSLLVVGDSFGKKKKKKKARQRERGRKTMLGQARICDRAAVSGRLSTPAHSCTLTGGGGGRKRINAALEKEGGKRSARSTAAS